MSEAEQILQRPDAILIAGPTASGKSQLALELASRWGGEIINADSMQIYPVLNVLTARPGLKDLQSAPHHLYGYAPIAEAYSVARWLEDAKAMAQNVWTRGNVPIFVGGTGLYFKALEEGLAEVPDIPANLRSEIRDDLIQKGSDALHQRLSRLDPVMAKRLRPTDGQRIARALEVVSATGNSLQFYQNKPVSAPLLKNKSCDRMVILPERPTLHERINKRAQLMITRGAIEEVQELLSLQLPEQATVLKAIGVRQLRKFINEEQDLEDSVNELIIATRQYAKRQSTWFRGQFDDCWQIKSALTSFL